MSITKEESLRASELSSSQVGQAARKWLVIDACQHQFLGVSNFADSLEQELNEEGREGVRVELNTIGGSWFRVIRKWFRVMPTFDSVVILYEGSISILKCILPAVFVSRFFGKSVSLGYYPGHAIDRIPASHFRILSMCSRVLVSSRYHQLELAKRIIASEVMWPPLDLATYPLRRITQVQPRMLFCHDGSEYSALMCALRGFNLVKQKYPRAELGIVTTLRGKDELTPEILRQVQSGVDLIFQSGDSLFSQELGRSDIFLNCNYLETAPLELFAAKVSGIPSISFDTYGAREIIENGVNGLLIRHNDHSQLAEQIIRLIEEPALVSKISQEAAKLRACLSAESIVRHFE